MGGGTNRREGRDSACGALRLKRLKKRRQDVHTPTGCLQAGRPPQWGYTHVLKTRCERWGKRMVDGARVSLYGGRIGMQYLRACQRS